MDANIKIKDLNENFVCRICNGYLIRPVAITECLHYFCRSCIVKYLETAPEYKCPFCSTLIHETNPWDLLREDKKLEFLAYKLVPQLATNEKKRRRLFYTRRGIADPDENDADSNLNMCVRRDPKTEKAEKVKQGEDAAAAVPKQKVKALDDSQLGFFMDFIEPSSAAPAEEKFARLEKPYLRTSSHITVHHLKKYLKVKLKANASRVSEYDILCNGELMGRHHTLEFIYLTRWRYKQGALELGYRPKVTQ